MNQSTPDAVFAMRRSAMVEAQLRARGIQDARVLAAMDKVPRHEFVRAEEVTEAYDDCPLPIGEGQTISQPYIVAAMLEALRITPGDRVLEVGTGSGYQAALLAELAAAVYSVERDARLAARAQERLRRLGYDRVQVVVGDGSVGCRDRAPYDAIVVSAAAPQIPESLCAQLREGGRMILPVGSPMAQVLHLVERHGEEFLVTLGDGCRFVPLIGAEGFAGVLQK